MLCADPTIFSPIGTGFSAILESFSLNMFISGEGCQIWCQFTNFPSSQINTGHMFFILFVFQKPLSEAAASWIRVHCPEMQETIGTRLVSVIIRPVTVELESHRQIPLGHLEQIHLKLNPALIFKMPNADYLFLQSSIYLVHFHSSLLARTGVICSLLSIAQAKSPYIEWWWKLIIFTAHSSHSGASLR